MDDKDNKDLRKEIEELEKLIEIVKEKHKEEKKDFKQSERKLSGAIRIDLATKYSSNPVINIITSLLMNFILIYAINRLFGFAEIRYDYLYVVISLAFTLYEELYKEILIRRFFKLVIYSSGLIFFFMNVIFFYMIDLLVFKMFFSFLNAFYPLLFAATFGIIRLIVKNIYLFFIRKITVITSKKRS
ncbi:MAG: hypothetical protein GX904_00350 [Acholeplasmataceae bacterium]|nr:hypothetical protein [Acholeplasmataceae bacterium]